MENNVTRDFLVAVLKDPSYDPSRLSPNWLASALLYRRPTYLPDAQDQWPPVQASAGVETGARAPTDAVGSVGSPQQGAPQTRPDIGMGRAAMVGAIQGGSAEFGDELAGGYAAGSMLGVNARRPVGMALQTVLGLARLGYETLRGERGPATEAHERGRDEFRADVQAAKEQYPATYYTTNIGAGAAVPITRAAQVATLPVRARRGAVAAGLFGGLSGVGSGETPTERAIQGVIGAAVGSVVGAGVGAVAPVVANVASRAGRAVTKRLVEGFYALSPVPGGAPRFSGSKREMFSVPARSQRRFEEDYPQGATTDAEGNLRHTMDGHELIAKHVAGWRRANREKGLEREQVLDAHRRLVGEPNRLPEREMKGYLGRTRYMDNTQEPTGVDILATLAPRDRDMVEAHELGHVIDQIKRLIPAEHMEELRTIYATLNNPKRLHGEADGGFTPWQHFYPIGEIDREYIAEAIRAYITDPNYIKTVAPNVARAIRLAVNGDPRLAHVIQFNSLAGAPIMAGGAAGLARSQGQSEPGL